MLIGEVEEGVVGVGQKEPYVQGSHLTSSNVNLCHHVMQLKSSHVMPYYLMSCYVILCYLILCYPTLCWYLVGREETEGGAVGALVAGGPRARACGAIIPCGADQGQGRVQGTVTA